jgi:hypothetical protein
VLESQRVNVCELGQGKQDLLEAIESERLALLEDINILQEAVNVSLDRCPEQMAPSVQDMQVSVFYCIAVSCIWAANV